jgi:hypothetical protein
MENHGAGVLPGWFFAHFPVLLMPLALLKDE